MFRKLRSYVRRHHVGLLALFIALGPAAYASHFPHKIFSGDIKDGEVKPVDVAPNSLGTGRLVDGGQFGVQGLDVRNDSLTSADVTALTGADITNDTLTGDDINESTLEGVNAASVDGASVCRTRGTISIQNGQTVPICGQGGLSLQASCALSGGQVSGRVVAGHPNGSFLASGANKSAFTAAGTTVIGDAVDSTLDGVGAIYTQDPSFYVANATGDQLIGQVGIRATKVTTTAGACEFVVGATS